MRSLEPIRHCASSKAIDRNCQRHDAWYKQCAVSRTSSSLQAPDPFGETTNRFPHHHLTGPRQPLSVRRLYDRQAHRGSLSPNTLPFPTTTGATVPAADSNSTAATVLDHDVATPMLGTRFRATRTGPENDLVSRFLSGLKLSVPQSCRVTVLREPALDSGYPDLVAVVWHEPTARKWLTTRSILSRRDVQLLQLLVSNGPTTEETLRHWTSRNPVQSLERLRASELVETVAGCWRATALNRTFAVRRIIAFEAKVSGWMDALAQASANRWFASESYILAPQAIAKVCDVRTRAQQLGVGVWIEGRTTPYLRATSAQQRQPLSYASWLFNECVWRATLRSSEQEENGHAR